MERTDIIQRLNDLIQLDVDTVEAYNHAIKAMKYDDIRNKFKDFQGNHQAHIENLTAMVQRLGGTPIKPAPNFKGYLIEGLTALRSITGMKGAIDAMKSNEEQSNKKYQEALALDFPQEVHELVKVNWADEQRHLRFIKELIDTPRHEF